jgi:iron complex outermembrane receptor protein
MISHAHGTLRAAGLRALVLLSVAGLCSVGWAAPMGADDPAPEDAGQYFDMDLQSLMNVDITVTSVAGVGQSLFTTPAAIYVIRSDDMRRTGARRLPEALRMVPGIHVSREGSHHWAVSGRGFHNRLNDKMQVVMDGRGIYDPMPAGVMWDVHDVVVEDLDRIEVIRGPGATLWGANAVNGVINIRSRSARDTQGLYLSTGTSTVERIFGEARYGGKLADNAWYRVWAKYADHNEFPSLNGPKRADDWGLLSGGMRMDIEGEKTSLSLIAAGYHSDRMGESTRIAVPGHLTFATIDDDGYAAGAYLIGKLKGQLEDGHWSLKAYYDRSERSIFGGREVARDTVDIELQHHWQWHEANELAWGLGWRLTADKSRGAAGISFDPADRTVDTPTAFVQNTWTIVPDRLFAMVGTKLEHNDFSGFEVQPSARLWWTPTSRHTLWASFSRVVRTPNRMTSDIRIIGSYVDTGLIGGGPPSGIFVPITLNGVEDLKSEELLAYEMGYRQKIGKNISVDVAAFINEHRNLLTFDQAALGQIRNMAEALSVGAEAAISWQVAPNWRLTGSYSHIDMEVSPDNTDTDGQTPHNKVTLRSELDVTADLELNTAMYYVDQNPDDRAYDTDYLRLDVGVTWRPIEHLELSVWGQNLLDNRHFEGRYNPPDTAVGEVPRSFSVQLTYRF